MRPQTTPEVSFSGGIGGSGEEGPLCYPSGRIYNHKPLFKNGSKMFTLKNYIGVCLCVGLCVCAKGERMCVRAHGCM